MWNNNRKMQKWDLAKEIRLNILKYLFWLEGQRTYILSIQNPKDLDHSIFPLLFMKCKHSPSVIIWQTARMLCHKTIYCRAVRKVINHWIYCHQENIRHCSTAYNPATLISFRKLTASPLSPTHRHKHQKQTIEARTQRKIHVTKERQKAANETMVPDQLPKQHYKQKAPTKSNPWLS